MTLVTRPWLWSALSTTARKMASSAGFVLIRNAIPPEHAQRGADMISGGLKQKGTSEKFTEYEKSPISEEIVDAFMKSENNKAIISTLVSPKNPPSTVKFAGVGAFHKTTADPKQAKTGRKEDVYVTIALTDLNTDNGWFIFLEGSHQRTSSSSVGDWPRRSLQMTAGDAVAWQGNLTYFHTSGGGGTFVTFVLV